ncbi:MAG TPA: hypothetical protein VFS40_02220 [Gemmatimonadales bacterium]|nr:hypothetical protein [Gemmatimonadales bacterium]
MRWLRLVFRAFGWLLTPFMAWAASFFGCVAGAMLATRIRDPFTGLIVTAIAGGLAGFTGLLLWLRLLRASPEIREVLAVAEDGTPDIVAGAPQLDPEEDAAHRPPPAEASS